MESHILDRTFNYTSKVNFRVGHFETEATFVHNIWRMPRISATKCLFVHIWQQQLSLKSKVVFQELLLFWRQQRVYFSKEMFTVLLCVLHTP